MRVAKLLTKIERREIRGYKAVREAAKDTDRYSSHLIGDRDTRSYKQLPLEYDPPRHTKFREALSPLFMSQNIEPKQERFGRIARQLIDQISQQGCGELTTDLALPYVMGCLTEVYNRPQDLEEWVSWGPDVWTAAAYQSGKVTPEARRAVRERSFDGVAQRSGEVLEKYLDRVFSHARPAFDSDPATTDVWDWVSGVKIDGEGLTRDEMYGIANVLLAGGRDTVIKLVTGIVWHLIGNPGDRDYLKHHRGELNRAIAEMARYLSPLPRIERVLAEDKEVPLEDRDSERYVLLNYLSANQDRSMWPDADVLDIHRERKPHLAFGFGRHSCMGMNLTEYEARAFLNALLDDWPDWEFDGEPQIEWVSEGEGSERYTVIDRFESVRIRVPSA